MNEQIEKVEQSSSGLDANAAGALCYVFGFFTGILFLATEKKSRKSCPYEINFGSNVISTDSAWPVRSVPTIS